MKSKPKGKSKGKGKKKFKREHTNNNKDNTWLKHLRICITASNKTINEIDPGRFSEEITAQLETALRIEDETLNRPLISKPKDTKAESTVKWGEVNTDYNEGTLRVSSLKRRLKMTFTGNPLKLPGDPDRHSCQIHSQDKATRSERSGSGTASLIDGNTTGTHGGIHTETKKSPTTPPTPKYLKYIRATNDYIFLDLDFLETDTSNKLVHGSPLSAMKGTKQQSSGVSPSGKKSPETRDQATKKGLQKQIEQLRSLTGTEVKTISLNDFKSPHRVEDSRQWNTVNLRCSTCGGNCPICSVACCRYAEAKQIIADTEYKPGESDNATQILQIIEGLANPEAVADVNASQILGNSAIGTIEDVGWGVNRFGYVWHTEKASCLGEYCKELR
ncbi:hypothetical protein BDV38DRAFT_275851 [Aspergillus pseudotamarii]|uniref:Uncharacterized protein n=1 Tax=Aspergillus pseudotamarii TaxID=132259 RepID=A0A5N6SDQ1_ASPPS|nr:uncharacterized protein BDV38DRAFT_275851 [Aspergillus pseudotamarii]KAE8131533.1 hypothetical protein BDV38DRAFT_275851 [Aspergillus pseudotamarii]